MMEDLYVWSSKFNPMKRFNTPFVHSIGGIHFKFEYVYTPLDNKFFVTATGINEEAICFEMIKDSFGNWKIIQPAPSWIISWEKELKETLAGSLHIWQAA